VLTQSTVKMYSDVVLLLSIIFIGDINDGAWSQRNATAAYPWRYASLLYENMCPRNIVKCNLYTIYEKREPAFIFI